MHYRGLFLAVLTVVILSLQAGVAVADISTFTDAVVASWSADADRVSTARAVTCALINLCNRHTLYSLQQVRDTANLACCRVLPRGEFSVTIPVYSACFFSCCSYYVVGRTTRRHPATSSRIFFPLHCSRHVHVIACPPPNIVYPCCSSSPRKTFSFHFTLNCSKNHVRYHFFFSSDSSLLGKSIYMTSLL